MQTVVINESFYNCTITKFPYADDSVLYRIKHNVSHLEIVTINLVFAYRVAKLLELDYRVTSLGGE